eukprot:TRINITY_DN359_c0_g1_i1.p1 TRINITY_DN359_c0_g1~~TRINITY_DN359_c0_g1_i1.p1  ORF type:complete len:141 (+),score=39.35 TRINITY_DN359_c0_g1_i1:438-860(+)
MADDIKTEDYSQVTFLPKLPWTWDDWGLHLMACRGVVAGGIYTQLGATCTQMGIRLSPVEVESINQCFKKGAMSIAIGDNKYIVANRDDSQFQGRCEGRPLTVSKTAQLYVVVIGSKEATPGLLSVDADKIAKLLQAKGL